MKGLWTCRRVSQGVKCGTVNTTRNRKCLYCGKAKPPKRKPAHTRALEMSYEDYVVLNDGNFCGICGREPSATRKLDRDHDHSGSGLPRGLLCARCNRALPSWMTTEWLRSAISYLETVRGGSRRDEYSNV